MTSQGFKLTGVGKSYGTCRALDGLSVEIALGVHTAILGPSGGGKSTLLRLLAGLETPTEGSISLDGARLSDRERLIVPPHQRGMAMVFQDLALWPNLTVAQNIGLGLSGLSLSKGEVADRANEALDLCDIAALSERLPGQLSGGQQQRAALARAIAVRRFRERISP